MSSLSSVRNSRTAEDTPVALVIFGLCVFPLCAASLSMLLQPYLGVANDAIFYTMQGLAHLRPELYGNDIYLKFGSQDQYTVFGPMYAAAIRLLGIDHAAALLTLVSQAAFLLAAWQLARRLTPARPALLIT